MVFKLVNYNVCLRLSGDAESKSAALGYFITPCVGTLVTLFSYLTLPRLVSRASSTYHDYDANNLVLNIHSV